MADVGDVVQKAFEKFRCSSTVYNVRTFGNFTLLYVISYCMKASLPLEVVISYACSLELYIIYTEECRLFLCFVLNSALQHIHQLSSR